jgi:hypothetical protein
VSDALAPALEVERLFPRDAAYMPRTDLEQTRLLGYTPLHLDAVSTLFAGVFGSRPTVRHAAGATPAILALYRRAGLPFDEELHAYASGADAERIGDALVARGFRLFGPYPLREGRFPDAALLVPPPLWRRLNAKDRLAELAPADALPPRRVVAVAELADCELRAPVFVKAAGGDVTGWGYAVRFCADRSALDAARAWFAEQGVGAVLVEAAIDVETCWCAGIAVDGAQARCFGAAEQIFSAPARQSGSRIDLEAPFPPDAEALVERIGEAARGLGFRGIAGIDVGRARDGRLYAFDPNFRLNASTAQVLFHASAAARAGLPASRSFQLGVGGTFDALAARLAAPIDAVWFVPLRLLDATRLPQAEGRHLVTGFVLGRDRAEAEVAAERMQRLLE